MPREAPVPVSIAQRRPPLRQASFSFLNGVREAPEPLSLENVDADCLHDAVAAWTDLGHAITFGLTSDRGALSVSLLHGGKRDAKYFTDVATLEGFLKDVAVECRAK